VPGPIPPVARAARSTPPAGFMRDVRARADPAGGPRGAPRFTKCAHTHSVRGLMHIS
jgi:hypothetical protein